MEDAIRRVISCIQHSLGVFRDRQTLSGDTAQNCGETKNKKEVSASFKEGMEASPC